MLIRHHIPSDFPAIANLRWILQTEDDDEVDESQKAPFIEAYVRHLKNPDRLADTTHWVIDEGRVVGVMTIRRVLKEPSPGAQTSHWGYLTNSIVHPKFRGQGLGTKLLTEIKNWATETGFELLIVWPSEASYPFYRRAGFTGQEDPLELVLAPEQATSKKM